MYVNYTKTFVTDRNIIKVIIHIKYFLKVINLTSYRNKPLKHYKNVHVQLTPGNSLR